MIANVVSICVVGCIFRHPKAARKANVEKLYSNIPKGRTITMEAYCVKCKTKRDMKDAKEVVLKNGRPAMKGTCPVCGTKMTRFLKKG